MKFSVKGTNISISYLFISVFTLYIAVDRTGIVLPMLMFFGLHELGHVIFIYFFGSKIKNISLNPGCFGIEYDDNLNIMEKILSVAAGPIFNVIAGLLLWSLNLKYSILNYVIAFYNLLPIEGLDGGTITKIILGLTLAPNKVQVIMKIINVVIALLSVTLFFLTYIRGYTVYTLIIFSIYLSTPLFLKIC